MFNKAQLSKDHKDAKKPRSLAKPKDKVYVPNNEYISKMGYRDDSPFNNRSYIDINTPTGSIDMSRTGRPLMANGRFLPPYSGIHQFDTNIVREVPLAQDGLQVPIPAAYNNALQTFTRPQVNNSPYPGYNALTNSIEQDPNSPVENVNTDWWNQHELFHHLQNTAGGMSTSGIMGQKPNPYAASDEAIGGYYNRRDNDVQNQINEMITADPSLQFIPKHLLAQSVFPEGSEEPSFVGADALMYADPSTVEGEARAYENYIRQGGNPVLENGGEYDLTDEEIEEYRRGGYVVEELPKAQNGITYVDDPNDPRLAEYNERLRLHKLSMQKKNQYYALLKQLEINPEYDNFYTMRPGKDKTETLTGKYWNNYGIKNALYNPDYAEGHGGASFRTDSEGRKYALFPSNTSGEFIRVYDPKHLKTLMQGFPIWHKPDEVRIKEKTEETPVVETPVVEETPVVKETPKKPVLKPEPELDPQPEMVWIKQYQHPEKNIFGNPKKGQKGQWIETQVAAGSPEANNWFRQSQWSPDSVSYFQRYPTYDSAGNKTNQNIAIGEIPENRQFTTEGAYPYGHAPEAPVVEQEVIPVQKYGGPSGKPANRWAVTDPRSLHVNGYFPTLQNGGLTQYRYAPRSEAKYLKDKEGNWFINLPSMGEEYKKIDDKKRIGELEEKAFVYVDPSKYRKNYDPMTDNKPQVAESTAVRDVNKGLENSLQQQQKARIQAANRVLTDSTLDDQQKQLALSNPFILDQKVEEYSAMDKHENENNAVKGKEYTWLDKAGNIARNPLVATAYAMQPGDFNMPMNYSELERDPEYQDDVVGNNSVLNGMNFASYFNPVGQALHFGDALLYAGDDIDKAVESGNWEDWKKALYSSGNAALEGLPLGRYVGRSGRLLNTGEQATLNTMRVNNQIGLPNGANNFLGNRIMPLVEGSAISVGNTNLGRMFPSINPNSQSYNPIVRNFYNSVVSGSKANNVGEAINSLAYKVKNEGVSSSGVNLTEDDVDRTIKEQIDWIQSDEYVKRRMADTKETEAQVRASVAKIIADAKNARVYLNTNLGDGIQGMQTPKSLQNLFLWPTVEISKNALNPPMVLKHEIGHLYSPAGNTASSRKLHKGFNKPNVKELSANERGIYATYPSLGDNAQDNYDQLGFEQQVRHLNARDQILQLHNLPKDAQLSVEQVKKFTDDWFQNAPTLDQDYKDIWLDEAKMIKDSIMKEMGIGKSDNYYFTPEQEQQIKEEMKKRFAERITDVLNRAWMGVPAAIGIGAAATQDDTEGTYRKGGRTLRRAQDGMNTTPPAYTMDLTDEEITQFRNGGFIVEELPQYSYAGNAMTHFQRGGNMDFGNNALELHTFYDKIKMQKGGTKPKLGEEIYTYADRPEAKYKQDQSGGWHIMLPSTEGQYVPINDPSGKRAGELNEKAQVYVDPKKFRRTYDPMTDIKPVPSETTKQVAGNLAEQVKASNPKSLNKFIENGVVLPDAPKIDENTPIWYPTNDIYYSPEEIEKQSTEYNRRMEECKKGDAQCFEQAQRYYNNYVAPLLNVPNYNEIKNNMGITSGNTHPNYDKYGKSADSWDIAALMAENEGKVFYKGDPNNPMAFQTQWGLGMGDPIYTEDQQNKYNDYWKGLNLPLGTIVNAGDAGGTGHYGTSSYNKEKGFVPSNHTAIVVGYNADGVPYLYDYGNIVSAADPGSLINRMGVTNIVAPKDVLNNTFGNIGTGEKITSDANTKLRFDTSKIQYDPDEFKPFMNVLSSEKDMIRKALGVSDAEYNELARQTMATALAETAGGDDGIWRMTPIPQLGGFEVPLPSYTTDKLNVGETTGISQINPDVLFSGNDPQLTRMLEAMGLSKDTYDPWDPRDAAMATMAMVYVNKKVAKSNYKSKPTNDPLMSPAMMQYYQWNNPGMLNKGEAWGEDPNVQRFMDIYNSLVPVDEQGNKIFKDGGSYDVMELTDDEIKAMRLNGYIVIEG